MARGARQALGDRWRAVSDLWRAKQLQYTWLRGVYKPHPRVYGLACDRLGVAAPEICFLSSNSWDAWSAKAFGLTTLWCNRFGQVPERIPMPPDGELRDLSSLPDLLGSRPG